MSQYYSDPKREQSPYTLPDVEVFYLRPGHPFDQESGEPLEPGWYYWYCLPGCLPDSEPIGPYETEDAAVSAMRADSVNIDADGDRLCAAGCGSLLDDDRLAYCANCGSADEPIRGGN